MVQQVTKLASPKFTAGQPLVSEGAINIKMM